MPECFLSGLRPSLTVRYSSLEPGISQKNEIFVLRRLLSFFRGGRPSHPSSLPIPDPFSELPHPGNQELFTAFKPFYSPELQLGSYNAHPDVAVRLYELAPMGKIIRANAYGFPVLANPQGLVFAWAKGGWTILIKLGKEHREAARSSRGRLNAEYGEWIEFSAWWSPSRPEPTPERSVLEMRRSEWRDQLRHWMQVSYDDSLKSVQAEPEK